MALEQEEELRKQGKALPTPTPPLEDWSPEVNELVKLGDRLSELIAAVIASAGQRPPKVYPARRPQTAYTRLEDEARATRHDDLVAEVQEAQERYAARRSGDDGTG